MKCSKYTIDGVEFACELALFNHIFGDRWKLYIVWHLLEGPKRFKELSQLFCDISEKTLSSKLKELEQWAIIRREVFAEVPPRVEYSLTDQGRALKKALDELYLWGVGYGQARGQ